jgi:hypothetical protein
MRRASITFASAILLVLIVATIARAQQIPMTVAQAEAEGAAFPHDPAPVVLPAAYSAFSGTAARRCVSSADASSATTWEAASSLRSGEMILRGHNQTSDKRGNKMLWMPLHDPGGRPVTLSIRGVRLGNPADTLRQTVKLTRGPARQIGNPNSFGFPSIVVFPAAGRWLVVANDDHDWGCFVLDVAEPTAR